MFRLILSLLIIVFILWVLAMLLRLPLYFIKNMFKEEEKLENDLINIFDLHEKVNNEHKKESKENEEK